MHLSQAKKRMTTNKYLHRSEMACRILSYYESEGIVEVHPFFADNALEKNASSKKNSCKCIQVWLNGMEKDDEISGKGNSWNYKFRMHNPRVGRFFSVDSLDHDYPWNPPYAFAENDLIRSVDLEGLEKAVVIYNTGADGKTHLAVITDRSSIEQMWQDLSVNKETEWIAGETRYKWYADGANTNEYYPETLEQEGVLIMNTHGDKTTIAYLGYETDNKIRTQELREEKNDKLLRQPGIFIEDLVDEVVRGAAILAPFTEGASLSLTLPGDVISLLGSGTQILADLADGKKEKPAQGLVLEITLSFLSRQTGGLLTRNMTDQLEKEFTESGVNVIINSAEPDLTKDDD